MQNAGRAAYSSAEFVGPAEGDKYNQVNFVVFRWGDPKAKDIFAAILDHRDSPDPGILPFALSTVIGDDLWSLALQKQSFEPFEVYGDTDLYMQIPFDNMLGRSALEECLARPAPRRPVPLGKVGPRWVLFELGMKLRDNE